MLNSALVGDALNLMRSTMKVISSHYPERSDKLFIVNAPYWYVAAFTACGEGTICSKRSSTAQTRPGSRRCGA